MPLCVRDETAKHLAPTAQAALPLLHSAESRESTGACSKPLELEVAGFLCAHDVGLAANCSEA